MNIRSLLQELTFQGRAQGLKRTYYVFQGTGDYLVASANGRAGLNITVVGRRVPRALSGKFRGREVTTSLLKRKSGRLLAEPFAPLNALYVMVALGAARKLKKREGRAMVFKIR